MDKLKILFLLFFICVLNITAQIDYPVLKDFVTDNGHVFRNAQIFELNEKLKDYEVKTRNQIVVLTIVSLEGQTIEEYALEVFEKNTIGLRKEDNGILILIAREDRKVRIEVGYGFEHIITDALSSRIIREKIIPNFKKLDYFKGADLAVEQIIDVINNPSVYIESQKEIKKDLGFSRGTRICISIFISILFLAFLFVPVYFLFLPAYKNLINIHRGLLVGKVGVFYYLILILFGASDLIISLVFICLISVGGFAICCVVINPDIVGFYADRIIASECFTVYNCIVFLWVLTVLSPLIIAFLYKKHVEDDPFKLSFSNEDRYLRKYIKSNKFFNAAKSSRGYSSSGSSSYRSSSSSSSSSGSFSGGGGSSGGGGASGNW